MSLTDIVAEARRQKSPDDLKRFLDLACGTDDALRQEILRQLARPDGDSQPPLLTTPYASPIDSEGITTERVGKDGGEAAASTPEIDVRVGDVLAGRYKIREEIGHGGMGAVFAADQLIPVERRVAVKVIKAGMDSAEVVARFAQERQVLALMDHPNIARIYDGGFTQLGRPYFVMELVRGLPLSRYCDQERLSVRQRVELFIPVCRAVQHAHQKGIIHRDLKPSNLLVTLLDANPMPKVIDFGVAKAMYQGVTGQSVYTAQHALIGTLEYMAPEQASVGSLDIDTRADVYSLGVILYELLCGNLPLSRRDQLRGELDEIIRTLREVEPAKPSTRVSTAKDPDTIASRRQVDRSRLPRLLKGELDWVVMKCLEKERDRRYETANGLAADLERYLRQEPVLAAPPSGSYRLKKFLRRHSGKVATAAAVLLLLIASSIATTIGWVRATRAERLARDEAATHQALASFIQHDLFDSIDPSERLKVGLPVDANVQLRTLIDRVSQQLNGGRLADQPLVEAALRLTLAKGYVSLGMNAEAIGHALKADQLRVTHLGPNHPYRLETMEMLGNVYHSSRDYAKAAEVLGEALEARKQVYGDDLNAFKMRFTLAVIEQRRGQPGRAEADLRQLLDHERRVLGADHEETLKTQRALGEVLTSVKQFDEAERQLTEARASWESAHGRSHPELLGTLNSLAVLYRQRGSLEKSEAVYRDLLSRAEVVYPADHPMLAVYRNNLSVCLILQKKFGPSLALLRGARPVLERVGPKHQLTLLTKYNQATVLANLGENDEANALFDSLFPLFVEVFGPASPHTVNLTTSMANYQSKQGNLKKALATRMQLLQFQRDQKPMNAKAVVGSTRAVVGSLRQLEEFDRAEALVKAVLAELPPDSADRPQLEKLLGEVRKPK